MDTQTILDREVSPYKLLAITLLISIVFMGFSSLMPRPESISKINNSAWVISSGMLLFYALANSVLSLSAKKRDTYWMHSIIAFAILLVSGSLLARLFSGISMDEAGTFRWIYFVFTFGYLVFLSIVNLIRFLVELAQRKDKQLRGEE